MIAELVSLDAEREVLAALAFHGREAWLRIAPLGLTAAAFSPEHRGIWTVLVHLAGSGTPANPLTVEFSAKMLGVPEVANDPTGTLGEATAGLGDLPAIVAHGSIVAELAQRRQVIVSAERMIAAAGDRGLPIDAVVREQFGKLTERRTPSVESADALNEALAWLDRREANGTTPLGILSGIPDLDTAMDGFFPGRLVTIAARPGCGKSDFAVWLAHRCAMAGHPALFVSLEMPGYEVWERRLSLALKADLKHEARMGRWSSDFRPRFDAKREAMEDLPLRMDTSAYSPSDIRLAVHRMIADEQRPKLVVVDHLGWVEHEAPKSKEHRLAIGGTTKALKRLAKDEDLCVVLLVQLSRDSVKEAKARRPRLSDLADSAEIERDSDQVILAWEPDPPETPSAEAVMELLLDKNRGGPLTRVSVEWSKALHRFKQSPWMPRMVRDGEAA